MAGRAPKQAPDPADASAARVLAVRVLRTRLVSRGALVSRLIRRGFDRVTAEAVATDLQEQGLLDDRKLAESLVRRQMGTKPAGKRVLVAKLRQRGIGGAMAKEAAEQGLAGRDELADAVDLARRRLKSSKAGSDAQVLRRRVFAYLARRGFDAEVCRKALDAALGDRSE